MFLFNPSPPLTRLLSNCLFLLLAFSALLALASKTTWLPVRAFVIVSGSMSPTIPPGSVVLVHRRTPYPQPGTILAFTAPGNYTVVHRLVATDGHLLRTAGDANSQPDTELLTPDRVIGSYWFHIPYLGYFTTFLRQPLGFILCLLLPAQILLALYLARTVASLRIPALILLMFTLIAKYPAPPSWAYFTDIAHATSSSFSPSLPPTSPPAPQIILNEVSPWGNRDQEWVELYNAGSSPVDLSRWSIQDNIDTDTFPAVTPLAAGGYAVILASPSAVIPPPTAQVIYLPLHIGRGLNNDSDFINLYSSTGDLADSLSYGTFSTPLPHLILPTAEFTLGRHFGQTVPFSSSAWDKLLPSLGLPNP